MKTDWWATVLSGVIGNVVGAVVGALVAVWVVHATQKHDRDLFDDQATEAERLVRRRLAVEAADKLAHAAVKTVGQLRESARLRKVYDIAKEALSDLRREVQVYAALLGDERLADALCEFCDSLDVYVSWIPEHYAAAHDRNGELLADNDWLEQLSERVHALESYGLALKDALVRLELGENADPPARPAVLAGR